MFGGLINNTGPSNYHDLDHCNTTRGIDKLLAVYDANNNIVTTAVAANPQCLIDNIWSSTSPLSMDDDCQCNMGYGDRHTATICSQCKNLRRIIDFRTPVDKRPFAVECGVHVGKQLMMASAPVNNPLLVWDCNASARARSYALQQQALLSCGTPDIRGMQCITGDNFTMRVVHTLMINQLFAQKNLPHSVKLHTAFICNNVGYTLNDVPTIGGFSDLKQQYGAASWNIDDVRSIILQLLVTLTELTAINFSHGNPSINGLLFDTEPVSYSYNGHHIRGRFTLKLANLWQASAKYGNYHYFPHNEGANMALQRSIFMPEITTKINNSTCSAVNLYRLTASTTEIYRAMRHIGFPLFVGSFDFYCLLISLMMDAAMYRAVLSDSTLSKLWTELWQSIELPIIHQRLVAVHNNINNIKQPVDLIRSLWLRCDVIQHTWNILGHN